MQTHLGPAQWDPGSAKISKGTNAVTHCEIKRAELNRFLENVAKNISKKKKTFDSINLNVQN